MAEYRPFDLYKRFDHLHNRPTCVGSGMPDIRCEDPLRWFSVELVIDESLLHIKCKMNIHPVGKEERTEKDTVMLSRSFPIMEMSTLGEFMRNDVVNIVRSMMHQMVCHEVDEWFLVNGQPIFNPHK